MMETTFLITLLAAILGFYMAWGIGANDVANSMATAVGAKAITARQAVLIAGILTAVGAIFIGSHVTGTVSKGILDVEGQSENILIIGFMSALLSAALWITLASYLALPISTTHSIVGAMIGFGLMAGGTAMVSWDVVGKIALSWLLSPLCGALIAFLLFKLIVKMIFDKDNPDEAAIRLGPLFVFLTFFIIAASLLMKTNLGNKLGFGEEILLPLVVSGMVACVAGLVGFYILRNIEKRANGNGRYMRVEDLFRKLQVMTSCYVAIAIGANDVANAIGPFMGIIAVTEHGFMPAEVTVPSWVLAIGGFGIAFGIFSYGYRVMKTIGHEITELTNTRGFSVDFAAATTVLMASKLGMPVSTTHTVVGAVIGVGLARGLAAIDLRVIKKIAASWLLTLPIAGATCVGIFLLLRWIFI